MKRLSLDLRERAIAAYDTGLSQEEIAFQFSISVSSVKRWLRRRRETGSFEALISPGRPRTLDDSASKFLSEWLLIQNDLTLKQLRQRFAEHGYHVGTTAIFALLRRDGISRKKTMRATEQDRQDVQESRTAWVERFAVIPADRLVFIDESAASTSLARLYGRCSIGQRLADSAPAGHWLTCTLVSAVRLDGPFAPMILDGPMDGIAFVAWVEQCLVPTLRRDEIVIMDNLGSHKVAGVYEAITAAGCSLRYLPPYSPDMNPIENMWSQVKNKLREIAARTFDTLSDAVGSAITSVSKADCHGFFKHCGYGGNL